MRTFKIIGALVVALAFSAIAVATASAAETVWKWLPGSAGETFKGKSGVVTLTILDEGGKKSVGFTCKKSLLLLTDETLKASSELLKEGSTEGKDATQALLIIHIEGCTSAGLAMNSTGDSSGIVLVHVEAKNCMIAKGDFGVLLTILPLTIEVPAAKIKMSLRGTVVGLLEGKEGTKALTFGLNLKTVNKENKEQEFNKCEGGAAGGASLEGSLDGVTFEKATEQALEPTLEFDMTKDSSGEEMMEK